jgi:hypothetical protein
MLGYCSEILERLNDAAKGSRRRPAETELRQLLVYFGAGVWTHSAEIARSNLSYHFDVLNVSEIDPIELVRDGDLADSVLAVL